MLDINFIRQNKKLVQQGAQNKGAEVDIAQLITLDDARRKLKNKLDKKRHEQNAITQKIQLDPENQQLKNKAGEIKKEVTQIEQDYNKICADWDILMRKVPNLPLQDVPIGKDEKANQILRQWGKPPQFGFKPKDHLELGEQLDIIDIKKAAEVSGARFAYLKGPAAMLELALINFVVRELTCAEIIKKIARQIKADFPATPFSFVYPPVMIRPEIFSKTGRLTEADKDDKFYLEKDHLYLVGSAEHSLGPFHIHDTLKNLPLRYLGFSTAFRREAGSYGRDTRGIIRMHQFDKLEMESFTTPELGLKEHEFFIALQEHLMQKLELPYQVVNISTGDMGFPNARQVDIETWLPSQNRYLETHSADYVTDFQARRLNIKYKPKANEAKSYKLKANYVHMNDATAIAIGRTLVVILENYQQKDGRVKIPKILKPYLNGQDFIKPKNVQKAS
jgi:seryl-tRNA synthetase